MTVLVGSLGSLGSNSLVSCLVSMIGPHLCDIQDSGVLSFGILLVAPGVTRTPIVLTPSFLCLHFHMVFFC